MLAPFKVDMCARAENYALLASFLEFGNPHPVVWLAKDLRDKGEGFV